MFEGNSELAEMARSFVAESQARGESFLTSSLAVGEVLVKPTKEANVELLQRYHSFFNSPAIEVVDFGTNCAQVFAQLRGAGVKAPDAIQLSCASVAQVDWFVTNDQRLSRLVVPGILSVTSLTGPISP